MARIITKELAEGIASKLKAVYEKKKNRAHDMYVVYHNNTRIASFGIRHGSEKDQGHDFIPPAIFVSPKQARDLGQCPMSYDDWVSLMKEKGVIQKTQADLAAERAALAAPEQPPPSP